MKARLPILCALALVWIWLTIYWQLQLTLPTTLESRNLTVIGKIADLPEVFGTTRTRFILDLVAIQDGQDFIPFTGRVRLTWYNNAPPLLAGELWQMAVKLKSRHGAANPGGVDYEAVLFRKMIIATGSVRSRAEARRLAEAEFGVAALREWLRQRLSTHMPTGPGAGIIIALILGDTHAIPYASWNILTRVGINHLVAISGLHLGLVGGLGIWLIQIVWRLSATLCRKIAAQQAGAVGGLLLAWGYASLAGFPVSTMRAVGMFALLQGALLSRRLGQPVYGFILALLMVVFVDPLQVLSPGFWLSFGAVAVLLYGFGQRVGAGSWFRSWGRSSWLIFIGLAPLVAILFGQLSTIAPVVNLVAIPIFGLFLPLLLGSAAIGLLTDWYLPLNILAVLLDQALIILGHLATQPWAIISVVDLPWWVWLQAFIGVILLLAPRGLPGRWVGIALTLNMWLWRPPAVESGALRFTLLDVGQGLAALIQTHSHSLIYDTGPGFVDGFNSGAAVLIPTLHAYGIDHVDRVIISHGDQDHAGGLAGLLATIPVTDILSGEPAVIIDKHITANSLINSDNIQQCVAGQDWTWDGIQFSILYPYPPLAVKSNDRSCVLQIKWHGDSGAVLLTGDLEQRAERILAAQLGNTLQSRVVVAGHHGSQSSTSAELLNRVRPQLVMISAGYRNRFAFPRPQVLARIGDIGASVVDTASGGALEVWFDADGKIRGPFAYRKLHARPWTHLPVP